jgi:uncharacterized protein (DUF983 family)
LLVCWFRAKVWGLIKVDLWSRNTSGGMNILGLAIVGLIVTGLLASVGSMSGVPGWVTLLVTGRWPRSPPRPT